MCCCDILSSNFYHLSKYSPRIDTKTKQKMNDWECQSMTYQDHKVIFSLHITSIFVVLLMLIWNRMNYHNNLYFNHIKLNAKSHEKKKHTWSNSLCQGNNVQFSHFISKFSDVLHSKNKKLTWQNKRRFQRRKIRSYKKVFKWSTYSRQFH